MDKIIKIKQKRQQIIDILNVMVAAKKLKINQDKIREKVQHEYCRINKLQRARNSLQTLLELFDYLSISSDSFDWQRHVFSNNFYHNIAIIIYGGRAMDDFKTNSVWVDLNFYADIRLLHKVCDKCVKLLNLTSSFKHYSNRMCVKTSDLYWFVCANICDYCFVKKLFTRCYVSA
ncbi:hypothetical protein [Mocis latipes granulovirus]|uniref:Uncharacterized protein n=1 Tax=Mocis latipes granulovirus TaxID=2072024 RepID=A0A162GW30_9BBAC|nr:hypothetical protein [Mocis latipes granulovirus]AKR17460.1 hypothetical protein [Mocis latipes granulovirus]